MGEASRLKLVCFPVRGYCLLHLALVPVAQHTDRSTQVCSQVELDGRALGGDRFAQLAFSV